MELILKNLQAILIFTGGIVFTVIVTRYKEAIIKGTNFLIDSLLALARVYFIMLKRYKRSVIKSYRETKVGYRNLRLDLERNYISLKVCSFIGPNDKEPGEETKADKLDVLDVMKEHRHLVILGHPGAGKTTLMQWLLLKYAYGHMKGKLGESLIPIFITLRSLESGQSIDDLLPAILKQHRFKGGENFIRKRMEKGKCLLIFDGMDEIVDDATQKKFIADICSTYANLFEKSRIIITSRIEEYPIDCFHQSFREREILDLDMDQVHDFVYGILKQEDKPVELLRQIGNSEGLKKFVTNPLMLSLLTFVYQYSERKLPDDRVKVYDKCMKLMMEDRDKSRGIYEYRNRFDVDDKELLLSKLALDFSVKNRWRFSEEELLGNWKKNLPPNLKENDLKKLLKEICIANGILRHLSSRELSFLHRTFQEYYSAKEICKRGLSNFNKPETFDIYARFGKKEWHEITLFLVGMMEDAGSLIQTLAVQSPQFALKCLVYTKRAPDDIVVEVTYRTLKTVQKEHIHDVGCDLAYLVHRFNPILIITCLATVNGENHSGEKFKNLWQVIDAVLCSFSPQKNMVYIPSGMVKWENEPETWIPGFWMDLYSVTNAYYYAWADVSGLKQLPRHWEKKPVEEETVVDIMKQFPVVDITFFDAMDYSLDLRKSLPFKFQFKRVLKNKAIEKESLWENRRRYLKKNKLDKSYNYYFFRSFNIAHARILAGNVDRAFDLARNFQFAHNRDRDLAFAQDLSRASEYTRTKVRDRDFSRDLSRTLTFASDLSLSLTHGFYSILAIARDLILPLARTCSRAKNLENKKIVNQFELAFNAAKIIKEDLNKSGVWTVSAQEKLLELGKNLVNSLVLLLELEDNSIPDDLLKALRQPGLLTSVIEYPPNAWGIYNLGNNVREWTCTENKEGNYFVDGTAWTEETIEPEKEAWYQPTYRGIDIGFRCVCEWDKIMDVRDVRDLDKLQPQTESTSTMVSDEGKN